MHCLPEEEGLPLQAGQRKVGRRRPVAARCPKGSAAQLGYNVVLSPGESSSCGGGTHDEATECCRQWPGEGRLWSSGTASSLGTLLFRAQGWVHPCSPSIVTSAFSGDIWLFLFQTTQVMLRTIPPHAPHCFQASLFSQHLTQILSGELMGLVSRLGGGIIKPRYLCGFF